MKTFKVKQQVELEVDVEKVLESLSDEEVIEEYESRGLAEPEKGPSDFSDDEIQAEYEDRFTTSSSISPEAMWEEIYRTRAEVPQIVKDFLYDKTGRILP